MPVPRLSPRIAIVQFQPKIGQVQANMAKARELCRGILPRSVDLVCLPEMVFSGYNFESAAAIDPYLEPSKIGPTSRFCAELASRLKCYVVAGYPERLEPSEVELYLTETGNHAVGANSAALYGPEGQWVGAYRKTNLFWTDKTWAKPGTGFATFSLPPPLRTVSLGICMDLNAMPPHSWTIETGPYELADYCLTEKTNVLVLPRFLGRTPPTIVAGTFRISSFHFQGHGGCTNILDPAFSESRSCCRNEIRRQLGGIPHEAGAREIWNPARGIG
ncbi:carbon-nitrogen hydrolase [Mycena galericulata]|nr:carbon-nitrogen hydrolase [Mycena galericulata]